MDRVAFLQVTENLPLVRDQTLRRASLSSRFRVRQNASGELEVQFVPRFTANGMLLQFMLLTTLASLLALLLLGAIKHWGGWDLTPFSLPAGAGAAARLCIRRWVRSRAVDDLSAPEYRLLTHIFLATFVLACAMSVML